MARDKAVTNAKIIQCMKEEFLIHGYEKASLNRISAKVGITTAALYKHYKNKEDMFYFLVKETLSDFDKLTEDSQEQMEMVEEYNPFAFDWAKIWVDFIYDHYLGMKLLICCSKGSPYETFEEDLIASEAKGNKAFSEMLRKSGKLNNSISDIQWHMLATAYVHLIFEVVRHDMTKDEAVDHVRFVCNLLYPGWKQLLGYN